MRGAWLRATARGQMLTACASLAANGLLIEVAMHPALLRQKKTSHRQAQAERGEIGSLKPRSGCSFHSILPVRDQ